MPFYHGCVYNRFVNCTFGNVDEDAVDKAPRLSIRIVIWILPSDADTLFGDDFYCICFDHPNRETAMLSREGAICLL